MQCSAGTLLAGIVVMYYLYNAFFQRNRNRNIQQQLRDLKSQMEVKTVLTVSRISFV